MSAPDSPIVSRASGILLILVSGCCWGFHGVMIKYAYTLGASFVQVFLCEAAVATVFFGLWGRSFLTGARPRGFRQWRNLSLIGFATVGVGNFLFLSYSLGPVAIAATLMFLYLPIVFFASIIMKQMAFSLPKLGAIILILCGAVLATDILTTYDAPGAMAAVICAVLAALCYGLVFMMTPIISDYTSLEFRSFVVSVMGLVGCLILLGFMPDLWFDLGDQWPKFLWYALFLGLVGQTLPVITLMKGLPITGSSLGGVLAAVELPIAIFSAAILLGESIHLWKVVGLCCVIAGILIYNFTENKPVVASAA